MDTVINRLSDIEKAAVSVMDGASERKKQMAREMEEKTAAFDAQLEKENQDRISQMEEELQQELRQQSEDAKATMKRLEATYENRHEEYAQALFKNMIKE